MVTEVNKDERGVGLQNFTYAPAWEEMCHIVRIHSPRAYRSLKEYLPMPSERHLRWVQCSHITLTLSSSFKIFRKKEARQPRFPMEICDQSFQLVAEHLKTLDYDGPVGLSCDDTKLFATYRLYWDSKESSYFLVGGVDGPMRVADPDSVKETIATAKAKKASKVGLAVI